MGRFNKYQKNLQTLLKAMNKLGFTSLLSADIQSPIIVTFISPNSKKFKFKKFYKFLKHKGYIIYPGKMANKESFRIGCIGEIKPVIMKNLVSSINDFLKQNKITIN